MIPIFQMGKPRARELSEGSRRMRKGVFCSRSHVLSATSRSLTSSFPFNKEGDGDLCLTSS